jgi:hypothetical protein
VTNIILTYGDPEKYASLQDGAVKSEVKKITLRKTKYASLQEGAFKAQGRYSGKE